MNRNSGSCFILLIVFVFLLSLGIAALSLTVRQNIQLNATLAHTTRAQFRANNKLVGELMQFDINSSDLAKQNGSSGPQFYILNSSGTSAEITKHKSLILGLNSAPRQKKIPDWYRLGESLNITSETDCDNWGENSKYDFSQGVSGFTCQKSNLNLTKNILIPGNLVVSDKIQVYASTGKVFLIVLGYLKLSQLTIDSQNEQSLEIIAFGDIQISSLLTTTDEKVNLQLYSHFGRVLVSNENPKFGFCIDQSENSNISATIESSSGFIYAQQIDTREQIFGCPVDKNKHIWPPFTVLGEINW